MNKFHVVKRLAEIVICDRQQAVLLISGIGFFTTPPNIMSAKQFKCPLISAIWFIQVFLRGLKSRQLILISYFQLPPKSPQQLFPVETCKLRGFRSPL